MLIVEYPTVTMNCRTAIKALFLYFNLCLSVMFESLILIYSHILSYRSRRGRNHIVVEFTETATSLQLSGALETAPNLQLSGALETAPSQQFSGALETATSLQFSGALETATNLQLSGALETAASGCFKSSTQL
jgi:hypothetical protein